MKDLHEIAFRARNAFYDISVASLETRNAALNALARLLESGKEAVFAANREDLEAAKNENLAAPLLHRLLFGEEKLAQTVRGLHALAKLPEYDSYYAALKQGEQGNFLTSYDGEKSVIIDGYYLPVESMLEYYIFTFFAPEYVITPVLGPVVSVIYQMVAYCMIINIGLAVFNLLPVPPFDGYHVLNDLVLKQDLFAQQRTARIASMALWGLIILGNYNPDLDIIGKLLNWARSGLIDSLLAGLKIVLSGMGLV